MTRCHFLYFVKYPEPGKVKTRLARDVGGEAAANLYRQVATENFRILQSCEEPGLQISVMFDPPEAGHQIRNWLNGEGCFYQPQAKGDLGERLEEAFRGAFESGAAKVVALGSDTLNLEASFLFQAEQNLSVKDVVIGPAQDGGYYLIGLSKPELSIFNDIPWSTPDVLAATLARARKLGLAVEMLPELPDLDEKKDLKFIFTKKPDVL